LPWHQGGNQRVQGSIPSGHFKATFEPRLLTKIANNSQPKSVVLMKKINILKNIKIYRGSGWLSGKAASSHPH